MKRFFFLIFASLFIFMSCTSTPKKRPPEPAPPTARQEYEKARLELTANDTKSGVQRLARLIKNHPNSDVSNEAYLLIAKAYFDVREYKRAYEHYMGVVNSEVFSPREGEALLGAARSLFMLGQFDEARSLSHRSVKIPGLSEEIKMENYKLQFSILTQLGDQLDALKVALYLANNSPQPQVQSAYRVRAMDLVESKLSLDDLSQVVSRSEYDFVRPYAAFKLGKLYFDQRDFDRARSYFGSVINTAASTEIGEQAQQFIDQLDARRQVSPKTIGAVLPLSGRHASIAQKTLRGLQLGLGIYGPERSEFRLAVIDSEGNPDQARRAVERLVTEDHVIAIAGSLLSKTAVAVAAKADELGVPSINLSQRSGITQVGETVFRNSITSEMQVRQLVHEAINTLGMKRFAVLYPNDAYGVEYTNLFWDEVLAQGGKITAAQTYNPQDTNFSDPVQRLVGTYYLEDRQDEYKLLVKNWLKDNPSPRARENMPADLLPPIVNFDAVFIPDSVRAVGQIAPTLAYHDVMGVKLLGTNLWNSDALIERGARHVESAVFVDSLLNNDESFKKSPFFQLYKSVYGEEPGLFELQGYDTGLILRTVIASGERTRAGVTAALRSAKTLPGGLGNLNVSSSREFYRPLVNLTVKDGKITKLVDLAKTATPTTPERKTKKTR